MPAGKRVDSPEQRVPTGREEQGSLTQPTGDFSVALPGGGRLTLSSADEVEMWNETKDRYIRDYRITRTNDLILLGALLSQVLTLYRAQRDLSDEKKAGGAQAMVSKASDEIRKAEKALGIDKASREKGGQHSVSDYLTTLKKAAFEKGVHISNRVKEYERVMMEARWKIRLLRNGDLEDRQYHRLTAESIIDWLEKELGKLEEKDKEWAKEKGAIWVGKL